MLNASWVMIRDPLARIFAASVALVGLPLAVTIVVIVACAVFGVTIDASRWRAWRRGPGLPLVAIEGGHWA